jgi:hypothetical protein
MVLYQVTPSQLGVLSLLGVLFAFLFGDTTDSKSIREHPNFNGVLQRPGVGEIDARERNESGLKSLSS